MKLCLRCNQYFEDVVEQCPADNSALEAVGDNPLIGALINDRYVVDTVIGKGSSGIVYKATRLLMQREVAVKVLHSYLGAESGSLDRFLREARAASQLKHPHIINIWESGVTDDGQPYFVMDYLEGSTLAELVKDKGALPLQRTLPIVRQICEALGEAHRQSIVHRDVKPENIVLQESDYANQEDFVKVLDFGIADQATGDQSGSPRQRTAAGSPAYMSPEQCQGFPLDLRSDIYSLAIVVYELLTGARPFEAEDIMTLFRMHVKSPPPSLSQIRPDLKFPVKLEMAINKALSKDPAQRQQDVMAFCKDVEEAVEGFLLETLENEYNTPGSERSGKAISTLVLGAAEDEDVAPTEKLHDYPQDEAAIKFGNSWNMPGTGNVGNSFGNNGGTVPLSVPGIAEPFSASPSAFSIPSKPQSPNAKQADAFNYNISQPFEENGGFLNPGQTDTENFTTSSSPAARDAESESASRLLQSAKRASQSFKTNLSNAGGEDVSDWARQILQRKTSPNVPAPTAPGEGNGSSTTSSANTASASEDSLAIAAISSVDLQAPSSQEAPSLPKITPVPPLTPTALQDIEDSPHVSAWAQQILKRKPDDPSSTGAAPERTSALQRIASTGPSEIISKTAREEIVISEMTVDVEEVPAQNAEEPTAADAPAISQSPQAKNDERGSKSPTRTLLEGELTFDESLTTPAAEEEYVEEIAAQDAERPIAAETPVVVPQSPQAKDDLRDSKKSPTRTLLEGDLTFDESLTAPEKDAGNEVQSSDRDLASLKPELSRPGSTHSRMSIQDAIDAQRKETGKFNSKDIEAWGAMIETKKASDAAAQQKNSESANVLHKLASTSNAAAKTSPAPLGTGEAAASSSGAASAPVAPTADLGATNPGVINASPLTTGGRRRFEDPVNTKVESSSKFAKEVEKVLDAAIFKTGEHNAHPGTSANGGKAGRIDATPNFDASRFEQPINKKTEKLNPFAKEIDKVFDSAIAKGTTGPKRTGDETGLMSSIARDAALEAGNATSSAKPTIRKEVRTGGSSGGPDLKKLLSRRKADSSSPNILDRAQQAAQGEAESEAATAYAHDQGDEAPSAEGLPPAEAEFLRDNSYTTEPTPDMVAAAESTLAAFSTQAPSIDEEPVKAYSRSELDAISFGKPTPVAQPEPVSESSVPPEPAEAPVKTPLKLDKMRGMDSPRQTQPGFGDKLKSIFGTKSGMSPAEKEGQRDKNKSTKAGIAAVTKDKDKKDSSTMSGMPATGTDKNTESGMTPVGKESKTGMAPAASNKSSKSGMIAPTPGKSTKSGLAAIGAFFGGGKKQATHQTMPAASIASPEPTIEQPQSFVANPMDNTEASPAGSAALSASASASASPYAQPFLPEQEEDDQPVFTSLSNADLTSKIDMADYSAAAPMPDGVRAQFTAPEFTPSKPIDHYQNQPTSFVFGNKTAEKEISDISEAGGETQSETQGGAHRSPVIAEALAVPSSTAEGAESATAEEPNAFERAVAEALAAEEARAQEQAALAAERAEREAAAAARAMAEIEAGKEAEARAKAQAAAEEARLQAEREAAEVRARTAAEASERAKFEEQERISRAEREARERAEREEAERAEAQRAAQEAELARAAAEARARAEREAAEQAVAAAAAAAAAATAATAAMMKLKEEEERRHREEQAAKEAAAREAALREAEAQEAAAREFAAREAAERHAAERQAAQMAAAQQGGPEIVDTPSKLSGKASQSQLAQMVNRFSKKGTSLTPDGTGAIPAAAEFTQPALEAAQAPMVSEMSTSQAPVDDQQAKSQKKFAELAQRLKSNAAKSSEAPVAVPPPPPPAPTSVAMSQQQPFSSQGDYAGSSYGSDMRSPGSSPSDYNRNTEFQPSNLPDFDLPHTPSGFPDARTGDPGKEPVQTEAFNKKIEAVKKKIEALKANVPGNAAAAAAGGAVAGGAMRPEPDQPRVYESAPPRQSMSASSANLGAPPVNRLLEAAQRAVETGSVSRLPAQRSDDDFAPAMPPSAPAIKQSPRRDDALNDSAVREAEASRKDAARASQEAYSSFRDIGASIKSERTKSTRDVPDRARVRQSFNKQRPPGMLIGGLIVAALAVVAVFTPVKDMIPKAVTSVQNMFHPAPAAKTETVESGSTDIDELISSGKLDRARALEDKQTKSNKWTPKDSERHIKMAEKYADSDPPEYELAIEVLNKIPKKAQFYRKAKTMIRNYQVLKRRSSH